MVTRSAFLLGAFFAASLIGVSSPAQAADVAQGQALARTLCSNCHIVGPGETPTVLNADIPSFMAIAAKDGQSADKIKAWVLNPHPAMPQVQLTKTELNAIAAYIMSLKEKP